MEVKSMIEINKKKRFINKVVSLYSKYGDKNYTIDEPITQLQHILEAYYYLVKEEEKGNKLVDNNMKLAVLLHDVGHLLVKDGKRTTIINPTSGIDDKHEELGKEFLIEAGLPEEVYEVVGLHVKAKLYLCLENKEYYDGLSKGSKLSYALQVKSNTFNVAKFKNNKYFERALLLRKCDDNAKDCKNTNKKHFILLEEFKEILVNVQSK